MYNSLKDQAIETKLVRVLKSEWFGGFINRVIRKEMLGFGDIFSAAVFSHLLFCVVGLAFNSDQDFRSRMTSQELQEMTGILETIHEGFARLVPKLERLAKPADILQLKPGVWRWARVLLSGDDEVPETQEDPDPVS